VQAALPATGATEKTKRDHPIEMEHPFYEPP